MFSVHLKHKCRLDVLVKHIKIRGIQYQTRKNNTRSPQDMRGSILGQVPIPKALQSHAPKAVRIVCPTLDYYYKLNNELIRELFLEESIKDRKPVIVAVAGDYRKGKSFLLNYYLRYLEYAYGDDASETDPRRPESTEWMGNTNEPLKGFPWRYGSERHTTGIWVWSKIFKATYHGTKFAIILMDTQGVFDNKSTIRQSTTVFALSAMLSSVTCYNISGNIQENDLTNLQFFTGYGRLALEESKGVKPFQKLMFVVRDWQFPFEADFGFDGGKYVLNQKLGFSEGQHEELKIVRQYIRNCFEDVSCFLLPHPGLNVTNPRFDGRINELQENFVSNLAKLVPAIFGQENLTPKKIDGQLIRVKDLVEYLPAWLQVLNKGLPEPKTLFMATAEANNRAAYHEAREAYALMMMREFNGRQYEDPDAIRTTHAAVRAKALETFDGHPKMGGEVISKRYKSQLEKDLEEILKHQLIANQMKKRNVWRVPALWAGLVISTYYLATFVGRISNLWTQMALVFVTIYALLIISFTKATKA